MLVDSFSLSYDQAPELCWAWSLLLAASGSQMSRFMDLDLLNVVWEMAFLKEEVER